MPSGCSTRPALDEKAALVWEAALQHPERYLAAMPPRNVSREELVAGLIRAGEREVSRRGRGGARRVASLRTTPSTAQDGAEQRLCGPQGLFRVAASSVRRPDHQARDHASRRATTSRARRRSQGPSRGSSRTHRSAHFPPNGNRVAFELMNIFRYDGQGRTRGGMGPDRQSKPAASVGRRRPLRNPRPEPLLWTRSATPGCPSPLPGPG